MFKDFAISIIQTLRQQGFQAYLAGGCVRDLLLQREPADYDIATSATPTQVMEIFPDTYAVGAQFGVVLVPHYPVTSVPTVVEPSAEELPNVEGSHAVEVATFRSDHGYSDGRRPDEVRFSRGPARRRCPPRLHDQRHDARSGERRSARLCRRTRTTSKQASSAPSAIPRSVSRKTNFACCAPCALRRAFEYEIEAETLAAIQRLAHEIQVVSRERVRDELTKMLTEGHARRAFLLLDECGLLQGSVAGDFGDERRPAAA